ncbi:hypothetical protein E2C01_026170 [Portunus trituberculatus]|uniref:Uncharacterized protein n=1 Tax=Portunus trituberculatus TaxID=210409 RepID=A0A5B7EHX4_PORTR|nr:hypothetical protein [Portunus trituberculatus]
MRAASVHHQIFRLVGRRRLRRRRCSRGTHRSEFKAGMNTPSLPAAGAADTTLLLVLRVKIKEALVKACHEPCTG